MITAPITLLAIVLFWTSALIIGSVVFVHVVAAVLALSEILWNITFNRGNKE